MIPVALAALMIGCAVGFALARAVRLRTLAALWCAVVATFLVVMFVPFDPVLRAAYTASIVAMLMGPPMAAGLMGGAVLAWLLRPRRRAT